jgi:Tol biopolymer transport system component
MIRGTPSCPAGKNLPKGLSMSDLVEQLRQRKLVQWTLAYLAGAWVAIEVTELLSDAFGWPGWVLRAVIVLLAIGCLAVGVVAWYHGERGRQRVGGVELLMLAALFVIAGAAVQLVRAPRSADAMASGAEPGAAARDEAARTPAPAQPRRLRRLTAGPGLESGPGWSPDGLSVAYVSEQAGSRDIWIQSVSGAASSSAVRLTDHPAEDTQPAWSPDGRHIAFVSSRGRGPTLDQSVEFGYSLGGDIWIAPAAGGPAERVLQDAFNPSWSPDGGRLAFDASLDGPRRIWVAHADGSGPMRVSRDASDAAVHTHPSWSPDGRWIAFQHLGGSSSNVTASDIALVPAAGGSTTFVTRDEARDLSPVWLDGDTLVFASDRGGSSIALWKVGIGADGRAGEPVPVTSSTDAHVEPAVSPDGVIAFASVRLVHNLWRLRLDPETGLPAGEPQVIEEAAWSDIAPSPSPDGRQIVFASDREGDLVDLWIGDVDGSGLRRLTSGPGRALEPVWAPDGRTIAYYSDRSGDNEIWVVRPAGGEPVRLTDDPADDINPYWSPGGDRIAFMSDRSGRPEVWTMRADGTEPRRLTDIGATGHTALWSPDGEWILFTSEAAGDRDIWAVPSVGGEPRQITSGPAQDAHGLWSADGRHIYYLRDHRTLWRVPFDGGPAEDVYTPGVRIDYAELSRDGTLLVFTLARSEGNVWIAR